MTMITINFKPGRLQLTAEQAPIVLRSFVDDAELLDTCTVIETGVEAEQEALDFMLSVVGKSEEFIARSAQDLDLLLVKQVMRVADYLLLDRVTHAMKGRLRDAVHFVDSELTKSIPETENTEFEQTESFSEDSLDLLGVLHDGRYVLCSMVLELIVQCSKTNAVTGTMKGLRGQVTAFAALDEGRFVTVSGSTESLIRVWDSNSCMCVAELEDNPWLFLVSSIIVLKDGRLGYFSRYDVRILNIATNHITVIPMSAIIVSLSPLPDGNLMVATTPSSISIVDVRTSAITSTFSIEPDVHFGHHSRVQPLQNGLIAYDLCPTMAFPVFVFDTVTMKVVHEFKRTEPCTWNQTFCVLQDGRLAFAACDRSIKIVCIQPGSTTPREATLQVSPPHCAFLKLLIRDLFSIPGNSSVAVNAPGSPVMREVASTRSRRQALLNFGLHTGLVDDILNGNPSV